MIKLLMILLFVAKNSVAQSHESKEKTMLKQSLVRLQQNTQSNAPLNINPLHSINFENYVSKGYLYYYRALAYATLRTTHGADQLLNAQRAIADLQRARLSMSVETKKIDELQVSIVQSMIDVLLTTKRYKDLINTIELLPLTVTKESKYIIYYAHALHSIGDKDSFKKFSSNHVTTLHNESLIKKHLTTLPAWFEKDCPKVLSTEKENNNSKVSSNTNIGDSILKQPAKTLDTIITQAYFAHTQELFKRASNLYFAYRKKDVLNAPEKQFVQLFERKMGSFAPEFIDKLIFSFWEKNDLKTATTLSSHFIHTFKHHPLYPKVLFNLARLQEDAANYGVAAKTYKRFLEQTDAKPYGEKALFRLALVLYLSQKAKEAQSYFEQYVQSFPNGRYTSASDYFLFKIQSKESHFNTQEAFELFIKKHSFDFYTFVLSDEYNMREMLLKNISSAQSPNTDTPVDFNNFKADIKTLQHLKIYKELKELGLMQDAVSLLKTINVSAGNELLGLYVAREFKELNNTFGQVNSLIKLMGKPHEYRHLVLWQDLFPAYKLDVITKELALQNLSVSPYFVLALMRKESVFNESARSRANAVGLMQLTAGTAKDMARQLNLKEYSLTNEQDNIQLGIKVLGNLLTKYNRLDHALSAYNAGNTPTQLWIKLRGHLDPILFIESIPYPETREYIKGVLRNYAVYRMLYDKSANHLTLLN